MNKVSIVVVVHNRENYLTNCLKKIADINYNNYEVIIVDDGSTDNTRKAAIAFANILPLKLVGLEKNHGICTARNMGIEKAEADFIAFIDSDCTVEKEWLDNLVSELNQNDLDAISGPVKDFPARNSYEEALAGTAEIGKNKIQGRLLVGGNMLFKTEILKEFKFDEALEGADDDDMQIRLVTKGKKVSFTKKIYINHDHPITNWNEFITLCKKRGRAAAQLSYKHNKIPRDIIPLIFVTFALILAPFCNFALKLALALFILQTAAVVYNELIFKEKKITQTFAALHILLLYHCFKAAYFMGKFFEIIIGKDPKIIKSRQDWIKNKL